MPQDNRTSQGEGKYGLWCRGSMKRHNLSKKERAIVNDFIAVLKKYKHLGPLKLAELARHAYETTSNFSTYRLRNDAGI